MELEQVEVDQRVDFDEYQKMVFDKEMKSLTEGEEEKSKVIATRLRSLFLDEKKNLLKIEKDFPTKMNFKNQFDFEDLVFILELRKILMDGFLKING